MGKVERNIVYGLLFGLAAVMIVTSLTGHGEWLRPLTEAYHRPACP